MYILYERRRFNKYLFKATKLSSNDIESDHLSGVNYIDMLKIYLSNGSKDIG